MPLSRRLSIVLQRVAILFALTLVLGVAYEQLGRVRDRKRLPQIGRSVDIGGRTLNIFCSGKGGPAVVFESGGHGPGLGWEPWQTQVAKFTQACWYDRTGIGWSDPGPYPRTSAVIARDLHALLQHAGVPAPYVLVGASFDGVNLPCLCRPLSGVGPITALAYVLTLEDPQRFVKSRDVGPYLGLVPKQEDSGESQPQLGISKTGDTMVRKLLVGSAQYILGPFGPETDLRRYGLRLCERGGKNAKKRAAVAVARKLAVLLHCFW
jgi:pimeloyl-ACP methyl ester carboxylesterase